VTLFAALDYLSGKVISQVAPRHRHNEWLKFLKKLDSEVKFSTKYTEHGKRPRIPQIIKAI
jgi:hypothetical protein